MQLWGWEQRGPLWAKGSSFHCYRGQVTAIRDSGGIDLNGEVV